MGVNYTYSGDQFAIYTSIELLCCKRGTYVISWLYINNKKVNKNPLYLRTSFALCHYLWYVWFSFSHLSRYFKISLLTKWPIGYFECV